MVWSVRLQWGCWLTYHLCILFLLQQHWSAVRIISYQRVCILHYIIPSPPSSHQERVKAPSLRETSLKQQFLVSVPEAKNRRLLKTGKWVEVNLKAVSTVSSSASFAAEWRADTVPAVQTVQWTCCQKVQNLGEDKCWDGRNWETFVHQPLLRLFKKNHKAKTQHKTLL